MGKINRELEPTPLEVQLERRGGLLVAVPVRPVPPLTAALIESTVSGLRTTRSADAGDAIPPRNQSHRPWMR